jgi:hypothetical protein
MPTMPARLRPVRSPVPCLRAEIGAMGRGVAVAGIGRDRAGMAHGHLHCHRGVPSLRVFGVLHAEPDACASRSGVTRVFLGGLAGCWGH